MSTQGDGMAEVTEGDREKAQLLCAAAADSIVFGRWERGSVHEAVDAIAAALAEEREKARAPFLALADAHERYAEDWNDEYPEAADVLMDSASRIRRAAEVTA